LNQSGEIRQNLAQQEQGLKEMQKRLFAELIPTNWRHPWGPARLKGGDGQKLDIKTYQVLASKEYGLYQEVHLRFNLMTSVDGLYFFLDRVKNSEFAILVQEINIQKIQRNRGPDLVVNVILAALMERVKKPDPPSLLFSIMVLVLPAIKPGENQRISVSKITNQQNKYTISVELQSCIVYKINLEG